MRKYVFSLASLLLITGTLQADSHHIRIIQQNAPAVVAVNVAKNDGSTFTGTGFFLTPDGLIATNRHVCENALYLNITSNEGIISGEAKVVAVAQNVDLALLKISAQNWQTVNVNASSPVVPGQDITVIGNPRRLQNTVSSGLISQVRQKADGTIWYQISAPISPSSSGSPVFDTDGNVISVAFASYPGAENQNLNFAVPSDYLLELVRQAGYRLPVPRKPSTSQTVKSPAEKEPSAPVSFWQAFWRHCQKSWEILLRIIHRMRSGT
jgi:S1-C subfamily serine protease